MCLVGEIFIICVTLVILFAPWMHAKADEIRERARKLEFENDEREMK